MTTRSRRLAPGVFLLSALMLAVWLPQTAFAGDPLATRARVMANIEKSRATRAASRFKGYAELERSGSFSKPAPKPRLTNYGPSTVPHDFVVRGGGIQPSVHFDKAEQKLKRDVRRKAGKMRIKNELEPWAKIEYLQKVIRQKVSHAGNELDPKKDPNKYNKFNQKVKDQRGLAKLGDYLKMHKVVCREMAFLTQVALEDAGFASRLVYGSVWKNDKMVGGHAWNEVKIGGKWQMVDTTNTQFNKADPTVASSTGTSNGWVWKRDTYGPTVIPREKFSH